VLNTNLGYTQQHRAEPRIRALVAQPLEVMMLG
jgi:hypothetical protein